MFDFRLKVFNTVAKRLSFTKTATELNITQPAVSKHVKEIEQQLNLRLFERNGSRIRLTEAGVVLQKYTEKIFGIYREMEFDLHDLQNKNKGLLRIGASTTIAQYVLPPLLASFHDRYKDIKIVLTILNTEGIELLLSKGEIDLGLTEGKTKSKLFQYIPFLEDEIVLATNSSNPVALKNSISCENLKKLPLLLREPGSGTLETIAFHLKNCGLNLSDLTIEMQLGTTESIKSYLLNSETFAFVSIHSILQELRNKTLSIIDVKNLEIKRSFYFVQPQGEPGSLIKLFLNFASHYNFK